jgi:hypothetical protein
MHETYNSLIIPSSIQGESSLLLSLCIHTFPVNDDNTIIATIRIQCEGVPSPCQAEFDQLSCTLSLAVFTRLCGGESGLLQDIPDFDKFVPKTLPCPFSPYLDPE